MVLRSTAKSICTSKIRLIRVSALIFQVYIAASGAKFTYLFVCFCTPQGLELSVFYLVKSGGYFTKIKEYLREENEAYTVEFIQCDILIN